MKKAGRRRAISLETKIKILDRLRKGDRVVDVAKSYSMNEATIRTIRTNENTIRKSVAAGNTTSMCTTSYTRNIAMEIMEKALMLWIEDQIQKRVPIDTGAIKNKALRIYEKVVEQIPSSSSSTEKKPIFLASHGWFERFKIRHSLHSLKLKGELTSGDVDAAQAYPERKKELSENDLVNLVYESESHKSDEEELVPVTFNAKVIREGLALARKLGNYFIQNDTNVERALRFQRDINSCLAQYEEIYKNLTKKELIITDFLTISHNVNFSAPNIDSAQITSSDESEL